MLKTHTCFSAFRGELTSHHPRFHPDSPAVCQDIDIKTAKQLLPNGLTVGIHMGTWHRPGEPYDASKVHEDIKYTEEDDKAIDDWISGGLFSSFFFDEWCSSFSCPKITSRQLGTVSELAL